MRGSTSRDGRMVGLDGLRAFAVVAVLAFHLAPSAVPGGFLGVDVFFVVSGFLITRLLLDEFDATGRIHLPQFWRRRARRLLPALAVTVVGTATAAALVAPDALHRLKQDAVAATFFATNWWYVVREQSYLEQTGRPPLLQHLWSLGVEEQFYLLWPLALLAVLMLGGRSHLGRLCLAGALGSAAWMAMLAASRGMPDPTDPARLYFGTDTHAAGLLLGAALAAGYRPAVAPLRLGRRQTSMLLGAGAAGLAGLVVATFTVSWLSPGLYRGGFVGVAALTAIVIVAATHPGLPLGPALDNPVMRWLGRRSYAIYLFHWPVITMTRPGIDVAWDGPGLVVAQIALTFALAEASYRLVETPVLRHGVAALRRPITVTVTGVRALPRLPRLAGFGGLTVAGAGIAAGAVALTVVVATAQPPSLTDYLGGVDAVSDLAADLPADPAADGNPAGGTSSVEARAAGHAAGFVALASAAGGTDGDRPADGDRAAGSTATEPTAARPTATGPTATGPTSTVAAGALTTAAGTVLTHQDAATVAGGDFDLTPRAAWERARAAAASPAGATVPAGGPTAAPLPSRAPSAPAPTRTGASLLARPATAVGDSVMLGARDAVRSVLPRVAMDAKVSRQPTEVFSLVRRLAAAGRTGDVVVIHAGTNGAIGTADLRRTLEALRGVTRVVVVTVQVPRPWMGESNRAIRAAVAGLPNVRVADWAAVSHGHPSWFVADGVHPTVAGQRAYAACIAAAVTN